MCTSKNSNYCLSVRKYRPENRSLREVNEDLRTELTQQLGKKCIFRGALKCLVIVFNAAVFVGCASTQSIQSAHLHSSAPQNVQVLEAQGLNASLASTAHLLEVGYLEPAAAIGKFAQLGFDATFFAPKFKWFFNYPELFILSKPGSNEVNITFVGTNGVGDWIENNNSSIQEDKTADGIPYVPRGHQGFRNGIFNLIEHSFFSQVLPAHIKTYKVKTHAKATVQVTLSGHSQGAGFAQLVAPLVDGFIHQKNTLIKKRDWPFKVKAILAFAPPYALANDPKTWRFMSRHYGAMTYQVIRDSDYITSVYSLPRYGHTVPFSHFGQYVRITRDDTVIREPTKWGSTVSAPHQYQPHQLSGYQHALDQATDKNQRNTER